MLFLLLGDPARAQCDFRSLTSAQVSNGGHLEKPLTCRRLLWNLCLTQCLGNVVVHDDSCIKQQSLVLMALVTVQRSPSPSNTPESSSTVSDTFFLHMRLQTKDSCLESGPLRLDEQRIDLRGSRSKSCSRDLDSTVPAVLKLPAKCCRRVPSSLPRNPPFRAFRA